MNRDRLIEDLKRDEGMRTNLYRDTVGKQTIGVGRNIDDRGISIAEAEFMLANDIDNVEAELNFKIPWWVNMPADAKRALANMCFNIGWPRLEGFQKMLAALKDGNYLKAADEALDSRWAGQVGARAERIAALIRSA